MGAAREQNGDLGALYADGSFTSHEVSVELWRIAVFEASQLAGEHRVERIGDHRKCDVEVDLG